MTNVYVALSKRIERETTDIDHAVQRAVHSWNRFRHVAEDEDIYLDSVALNIHGFYGGIERIFEQIANHIDQQTPQGADWHRTLLIQMSREDEDRRPAVISAASAARLDEYRRFRHLVRNVYAQNFVPERIGALVENLGADWSQVYAELTAFADFLARIGADTEGT